MKVVRNKKNNILKYKYNQGMTLLISSIILVGMLYLSLAAMQSTLINRKVATNVQVGEQLVQATESVVRMAEQQIINNNPDSSNFTENCQNGYCKITGGRGIWKDKSKWTTPGSLGDNFKKKSKFFDSPEFVVEFINERKTSDSLSQGQTYQDTEDYTSSPVYRVTGKTKDKKGNRESVIQSTIY